MPNLARPPYPSAPLRFVAFEVQFGLTPTLATPDGQAALYESLRETYPISDAQVTMQVTIGPQGAVQSPPTTAELVMINRDRTRSITIGGGALTVQSTVFSDSAEFAVAITEALRAVESAGISASRRVGLRFIDEIRVPEIERADQWDGLLSPDLIGPVHFADDVDGCEVESSESRLALKIDDDVRAVMRFGPNNGSAVDARGRLRLPLVEEGHFFLLDIDTFWVADEDDLVPFAGTHIIDTYWRLDDASHRLFEHAIEDRARDLFRKENPS